MSVSLMAYFLGMAAIFAGERLLGSYDAVRWIADLVGIVAVVLSVYLRLRDRSSSNDDGVRLAHTRALVAAGVASTAVVIYAISTDGFAEIIGLQDVMKTRWQGVFGSIWPIVWLCGTLPLFTIDRAVETSPVMMPARRVQQAMSYGLIAALGISLVFPINFVASRHSKVWDFSYFKTSQPGTTTSAIVKSLKTPVVVRIFQPTSSDVLPDLIKYFEPLEGPTLSVEIVDQAEEPKLAQDLKVRNNGFIAISEENPESGGKPLNTQLVNVGADMKDARRNLRKLDEIVGKAFLGLARGEMTAYVTRGHGELTWDRNEPPQRSLKGFKQLMEYFNINLKTIGMADGLAEEIPQDADMLVILGPDKPFLPAEIAAITRYLERGGSLILALEPVVPGQIIESKDALVDLLSFIGVKKDVGILASEQQIVSISGGKFDRVNITIGTFSTHPSTVVLAAEPSGVMMSLAGGLELMPGGSGNPIVTVRTTDQTWSDMNQNLEFDQDSESKKARPVVIASTGKGAKSWRAVVTGDSTMFSDLAAVVRGNQQFMSDTTNWLARTEAYAGTQENEEDVRIQHTKEGQAGWFYTTVLGFPAILMVIGLIRTRRRVRGAQ